MQSSARYVFHSVWHVAATPIEVHQVLCDYKRYPMWWPQVRSVQAGRRGPIAVVRSALPYDLVFETVQHRLDGLSLVGELFGDLEGTAQWTLQPVAAGTRVTYDQDVQLNRAFLQRLSPVLRPVFRLNHAWMMRCGRRGLSVYLAGRHS